MKKTLVVYGTTTGSCEDYAGRIASRLGADVKNVTDMDAATIASYDNLIIGTSTWGAGELQDDWYDGVKTLRSADLRGKTIAIFGCGDAADYGDTFCGGMAELRDAVKDSGANIIGEVDADTYTYDDSPAVTDGKFAGLAIDVTEDDSRTDERIDAWTEAIKSQL